MGWLLLLTALTLLLYLLYESRQRTRQLNNTLKDISTGIYFSTY